VDETLATKGTGMGILGISVRDWRSCKNRVTSGQCITKVLAMLLL